MFRSLVGAAAALALAASTGSAFGAQIVFTPADFTTGTSVANLTGATVTSSPRPFDKKTIAGIEGLGVQGGFVDGEIDLSGPESITFTFANPTQLTDLQLAFLYKDGNFGDIVSEVARLVVTVAGVTGQFLAADLSVITPTTATFGYSGQLAALVGAASPTPANLSPASEPNAGLWDIANAFGNLQITSITFQALQVGGQPAGSSNSDYAIARVVGVVPEPATIGLLGLGLLGLALRRRRTS